VLPNLHFFHANSRELTKFHTFSREFTNFHTFSRNLFFLPLWTANNAQNSLSWAFSHKKSFIFPIKEGNMDCFEQWRSVIVHLLQNATPKRIKCNKLAYYPKTTFLKNQKKIHTTPKCNTQKKVTLRPWF
jgi:hypothetical protein